MLPDERITYHALSNKWVIEVHVGGSRPKVQMRTFDYKEEAECALSNAMRADDARFTTDDIPPATLIIEKFKSLRLGLLELLPKWNPLKLCCKCRTLTCGYGVKCEAWPSLTTEFLCSGCRSSLLYFGAKVLTTLPTFRFIFSNSTSPAQLVQVLQTLPIVEKDADLVIGRRPDFYDWHDSYDLMFSEAKAMSAEELVAIIARWFDLDRIIFAFTEKMLVHIDHDIDGVLKVLRVGENLFKAGSYGDRGDGVMHDAYTIGTYHGSDGYRVPHRKKAVSS